MAAIIVDRGLENMVARFSNLAGNAIASMSVDDSDTALAAGTTNLGNPANWFAKAFDSGSPSRSGKTVSHVTTFGTGEANFTIKRIVLHDVAAASVTGSSATVVGGVDGQSIAKTSSFSLKLTVDVTGSSA